MDREDSEVREVQLNQPKMSKSESIGKVKLLPFVLKFIGISLVLFVFWGVVGEYLYFLLVSSTVPPFLRLFGIELILLPILIPLFYNFLPFITLYLIIPGIKSRKNLQNLFLGLFIIFLWQMLIAEILFLMQGQTEGPASAGWASSRFIYFLNWCIPIILWLILARNNLYGWFISR